MTLPWSPTRSLIPSCQEQCTPRLTREPHRSVPRHGCLAHTELTQLPAAGANNYLGLSNHPRLVAAAHAALDEHGFGLSSVRFICGTQAWTSVLHHLALQCLSRKHHCKLSHSVTS